MTWTSWLVPRVGIGFCHITAATSRLLHGHRALGWGGRVVGLLRLFGISTPATDLTDVVVRRFPSSDFFVNKRLVARNRRCVAERCLCDGST